MEKMNLIQEELRQISPFIATIEKVNVYSVPPVYFENLGSEILQRIKPAAKPGYLLSNINPYQVPEGYFESLPGEILEKVEAQRDYKNEVIEEMEQISPLLNTIDKKPIFDVPPDYFAQIQKPASDTTRKEGRIVTMKLASRRFIRYAVAAVIISILAVGAFFFTIKDSRTSQAISNSTKAEVKNLSEHEIVEFLKKNASSLEVSSNGNTHDKENEIKNAVKEITDKEIQQFLHENAVSDEI
ncbi:MAG TPA: hypothetical protein VF540_04075 [Segetibacter sp.]